MLQRVIIVGCGIAGPLVGLFLRRVGVQVELCEARSREAGNDGAFLGVAPNGMNVLDEAGVRAAVEAVSVRCHAFQFQNARGQLIGAIDRREDPRRFGTGLQMIRRADLHHALTAAAESQGVRIHFDRRLLGVEQDGDRVTARFSDGSAEVADALLGCDGIRSATRQLVMPDAPAPTYSGLVDHAGFVHCPEAPLEPGVNVMVFGRRAFFGAFKTPAGDVWWFHNGGVRNTELIEREPQAVRARMLQLHREDPAWIAQVIDATPTVLGPFALHDILSLPRWHVGRVCLLGDAAHATTPSAGQGASLAMEDALVLAQCLRDVDDPARAFATFQRARQERVERIVRQSRRNGSGKAVSGPVGEWVRDRLLPWFLRFGEQVQSRQYAHRLRWTEHAPAA
ncbi:MAG: NAD(P)/FAD-dependent oxidoreductase [Myxococcota bacterium]